MEEGHREEISYRRFTQKDMTAATQLAWDAWARSDEDEEESDEIDPRVMGGYVSSFIMRSNWNEVAYDSHGVIGVLFGRIDALPDRRRGLGSVISELGLIPGFLFNRYGSGAMAPAIVYHFLMTEFKVFLKKPRADAEINLIIVDTSHRGRGIGRAMVERFIKAARDAGSSLITLYTDNQLSNWRFYEILGFKKVATFRDGLTSYFTETEAEGIVYSKELK